MRQSYMGLISANQNTDDIRGLTKYRLIASIPFAGRYRIIDFALSSLTRTGISNVGILVRNDTVRSLRDHIRGGQFWDLNRKDGGIFLLHPTVESEIKKEDISHFKANLEYLNKSKEENVVIYPGHLVGNIDMKEILRDHEKSGKDLTVVYKKVKNNLKKYRETTTLIFDESNKVRKFGKLVNFEGSADISLEIKVIKKDLLISLIMNGVQNGFVGDLNDFVENSIDKIDANYHEYTGYTSFINSTTNYFETSKDVLKGDIRKELLLDNGGISTKINDTAPAHYADHAEVNNSLIANGCFVEGSVKNSIIGRRVKIGKNATIENSIILQSCTIEEGAEIKNVIIDKNITIGKYQNVIGSEEFPLVIEKKPFLGK